MDWRNYTWVLGVAGMMLLVGAGSVWLVAGTMNALATGLAIGSVVSLAAYALLDRDRLQAGAQTRAFSYAAGAVMVSVLGAVLCGMLVTLAHEFDQTTDLTSDGTYTLSPQTRSVLDGLESPVEVYAIFRKGGDTQLRFDRLATRYTQASDKFVYEHIDPMLQPQRVHELIQKTGRDDLDRISEVGAIVMRYGKRRRRIESKFTEESVTNNIVRLTSGTDHMVCWSQGHMERSPDKDDTPGDYGIINLRLEDRNFVIMNTRILTQGIRSACEVMVIAGPMVDFAPVELDALDGYVAGGGQLVVLLDSPVEGARVSGLAKHLLNYGVRAGEDVVLENSNEHVTLSPEGEPLQIYGPNNFKPHPITNSVPQGIVVAWPRSARAVAEDVPGIKVQELFASSSMSWADLNFSFDQTEPPTPELELGETLRTVPMAVVTEIIDPSVLDVRFEPSQIDDGQPKAYDGPEVLKPRRSLLPKDWQAKAGGRVLVIGDADIASNKLASLLNNGDLYLNSIAYLVKETDQLGVGATDGGQYLTLSTMQTAILLLVGVLLVPGGCALLGIILLVRRRFL